MDMDLRQLIKAKIIKHERINDGSSSSGQHVDMVVERLKRLQSWKKRMIWHYSLY
jgi:hypothetical protein